MCGASLRPAAAAAAMQMQSAQGQSTWQVRRQATGAHRQGILRARLKVCTSMPCGGGRQAAQQHQRQGGARLLAAAPRISWNGRKAGSRVRHNSHVASHLACRQQQ